MGFCNLTLADDALRASPHVGIFMPCRAVVYQRRERVVRQAETDILEILTEVAGD